MKSAAQAKNRFFHGEDDEDAEAECPICLETMPVMTWTGEGRKRMVCCGNSYCDDCAQYTHRKTADNALELKSLIAKRDRNDVQEVVRRAKELKITSKCPLCRKDMPKTEEERFRYTLSRAKSGDKMCQYLLGGMYESGGGTKMDNVKATRWYKAAAEQGVVASMYKYAVSLEYGTGCEQSQPDAVRWMEQAANAGYPPAQCRLGLFYYDGDGVEVNIEKGIQLLEWSAEEGCKEAYPYLGRFYMHGEGVRRDVDRALPFLTSAAVEGHPKSQIELEIWYEANRDSEKCRVWLRESSKENNPNALFALGNIVVENACQSSQSIEKAPGECPAPTGIKLFRRAAALGHFGAANSVGKLERIWSSQCANCRKGKTKNGKLLRCSKCKLMHYCSKECQTRHWKAGHKRDCCELE